MSRIGILSARYCLLATAIAGALPLFAEEKLPEKFTVAFAQADKNGDGRVSLEEFSATRSSVDVANRDFRLFDLNGDGFMVVGEFSAVPNVVPGNDRGPLPDPMIALLDQVVAGLDKALGDWNEHPDAEVTSNHFITALNNRFGTNGIRFDATRADTDGNSRINRAEARRFMESQLGIRRGDGKLLRFPDGRVFNNNLFLHVDENKNDQLERNEFVERAYCPGDPVKEFESVDANRDGVVSFEEWCTVPGRGLIDPVLEFLQMDTNLDSFLSPEELKAGTADWKKNLAANVFPGFDLDHDGKLSLAEYRFTPQSNMVLNWNWPLSDTDNDGKLSFQEYQNDPASYPQFDRFQFPLLRYTYFHLFDVNADGYLDPTEYIFNVKARDELFVMNEDGTGWQPFFRFEGYLACGSVAVSPDGKSLAFDAWQKQGQSAIFVMAMEGGKPRELCSGMMPNWSKDSQFLTCSRSQPIYGVWLLEMEGDGREHLVPGWGAQWSPDGERIAFTEGRELKVLNIVTDQTQTLLTAETNPYQQIFWNMTWSPDSKRLCLKGITAEGNQEIATISTVGDKPDLKVHHSTKDNVYADFAWHPNGARIICSMHCATRGYIQLYEFNPNTSDPPVLVKGQDPARNNTDASWTPDGKRLIVVSGDF